MKNKFPRPSYIFQPKTLTLNFSLFQVNERRAHYDTPLGAKLSNQSWVSSNLHSFLSELKRFPWILLLCCLIQLFYAFRFPGKVHGSLARAGKVRGQTPKVAKQDKKKKPRGRAHKRMQYNRRFVTAGNSLTPPPLIWFFPSVWNEVLVWHVLELCPPGWGPWFGVIKL